MLNLKNINLLDLEDLRDENEIKLYFKAKGIDITDEEISQLKDRYSNLEKNSSSLSLEQLNDVAGGVLEFFGAGITVRSTPEHSTLGKIKVKKGFLGLFGHGKPVSIVDFVRDNSELQLPEHIDFKDRGDEVNFQYLKDLLNHQGERDLASDINTALGLKISDETSIEATESARLLSEGRHVQITEEQRAELAASAICAHIDRRMADGQHKVDDINVKIREINEALDQVKGVTDAQKKVIAQHVLEHVYHSDGLNHENKAAFYHEFKVLSRNGFESFRKAVTHELERKLQVEEQFGNIGSRAVVRKELEDFDKTVRNTTGTYMKIGDEGDITLVLTQNSATTGSNAVERVNSEKGRSTIPLIAPQEEEFPAMATGGSDQVTLGDPSGGEHKNVSEVVDKLGTPVEDEVDEKSDSEVESGNEGDSTTIRSSEVEPVPKVPGEDSTTVEGARETSSKVVSVAPTAETLPTALPKVDATVDEIASMFREKRKTRTMKEDKYIRDRYIYEMELELEDDQFIFSSVLNGSYHGYNTTGQDRTLYYCTPEECKIIWQFKGTTNDAYIDKAFFEEKLLFCDGREKVIDKTIGGVTFYSGVEEIKDKVLFRYETKEDGFYYKHVYDLDGHLLLRINAWRQHYYVKSCGFYYLSYLLENVGEGKQVTIEDITFKNEGKLKGGETIFSCFYDKLQRTKSVIFISRGKLFGRSGSSVDAVISKMFLDLLRTEDPLTILGITFRKLAELSDGNIIFSAEESEHRLYVCNSSRKDDKWLFEKSQGGFRFGLLGKSVLKELVGQTVLGVKIEAVEPTNTYVKCTLPEGNVMLFNTLEGWTSKEGGWRGSTCSYDWKENCLFSIDSKGRVTTFNRGFEFVLNQLGLPKDKQLEIVKSKFKLRTRVEDGKPETFSYLDESGNTIVCNSEGELYRTNSENQIISFSGFPDPSFFESQTMSIGKETTLKYFGAELRVKKLEGENEYIYYNPDGSKDFVKEGYKIYSVDPNGKVSITKKTCGIMKIEDILREISIGGKSQIGEIEIIRTGEKDFKYKDGDDSWGEYQIPYKHIHL